MVQGISVNTADELRLLQYTSFNIASRSWKGYWSIALLPRGIILKRVGIMKLWILKLNCYWCILGTFWTNRVCLALSIIRGIFDIQSILETGSVFNFSDGDLLLGPGEEMFPLTPDDGSGDTMEGFVCVPQTR